MGYRLTVDDSISKDRTAARSKPAETAGAGRSEPSRERTVAFFHVSRGDFGGGSRMLLKLLRSLSGTAFEPLLVSQADDELCERARESRVTVRIVPFRGILDSYNRRLMTTSPRVLLPAAFRAAQFNRAVYRYVRDADAIWCQNVRALLTLLPCASLTSAPLIWNIGLGLESTGPAKYLNTVALSAADYVFIESKTQARRTFTESQLARYGHKFVVFNKGIDVDKFRSTRERPPLTDSSYAIGTAAALSPRKGIEHLLDATGTLLATGEDVHLHVAGDAADDAEYVDSLYERMEASGIEESVTFHGWVEDMPGFLDALDVFVLPSLNEGIPGAVREALAMELPVIATDVGGTSDVVKHRETGLLVPPADSNALGEALETMLANDAQARQMGTRGRELIVDEFSLESYVRNYRAFLNEVSGK